MSEEYTAEVFLNALSEYIKENDKSLKEGAEKGGHSYVYERFTALKIRVTANLDNSGAIAVSIYSYPAERTEARKQKMTDLSEQLSQAFSVKKSTIWIETRRRLANLKDDIGWTLEQIEKLKHVIKFIETNEALPEDLKNREGDDAPKVKSAIQKNRKTPHIVKQMPVCCHKPKDLSLSREKFVEFGDTKIPDAKETPMAIKKMASWALWYRPEDGDYNSISKMDVGQMFTGELEQTLPQLQPDVVLLGLNCSRDPEDASDTHWQNVHSTQDDIDTGNKNSTVRNVKSLRFACSQTFLRGAYFTDLFKNWVDPRGQDVSEYFDSEEHAEELKACAKSFAREIAALRRFSGSRSPLTIVCFGDLVYGFLQRKEFLGEILNVIGDSLLLVGWLNHYTYLPEGPEDVKMDLCTEQVNELEAIRNAVSSNIGSLANRGVLFMKKPETLDDKSKRFALASRSRVTAKSAKRTTGTDGKHREAE